MTPCACSEHSTRCDECRAAWHNGRTVAARIRQGRARLGLSQAALGDALGVPQSSIARWEGGDREPTVSRLIGIADALGVSLDWLAGRV